MKEKKLRILHFKQRDGTDVFIPFDNLKWCESDGDYVNYHFMDGEGYRKKMTLKSLLPMLDDEFMQIHESFIVNKSSVCMFGYDRNKKNKKNKKMFLVVSFDMINKLKHIPVSRNNEEMVKIWLNKNPAITRFVA